MAVTVSLRPSDVKRLTRGMTPLEKAAFVRSQTTHPAPTRIGDTSIFRVRSLELPEYYLVDTEAKSCNCRAGHHAAQREQPTRCWHYAYVRLDEELGPYTFGIRRQMDAAADRYERETSDAAINLPLSQDYDEWRSMRGA